MIESDPVGFIAALAGMALAVYLLRIGGYWLIGRVSIGRRLRRMLDALPGAVISASLAPVVLHGGGRAVLAMAAAAGIMVALRNDFAAVLAGVAVAAAGFALGF